ncbi:putative disease resistance RPP13-like protein 1 [Sesamum angolense]|uniref:Disease resistance RPP13-like protein 1 n=1 Tax=Sesamum angolense TaxID=2727404 RepID=A0AAE2BP60_9LAMI|nr:putative disease resistance RPP13-like protein 1 [Sesamum angolense]
MLRDEEERHSILESELWDMPQTVLMLSYVHLPAHLRRCFAYCSIFPQNHEFEVEELVLLWMAEGFIQPAGARRLEDLGADYFHDLYSTSFFQQYKNTSNKTIYKMYDLIHDYPCADLQLYRH